MKNIVKLKTIRRIAGIIALAAVIGFSMAACDNGSTGDDANPFAQFNGEFKTSSGETWVFNGTNRAQHQFSPTISVTVYDCEIKLENGHFWYRLWNNPYSE